MFHQSHFLKPQPGLLFSQSSLSLENPAHTQKHHRLRPPQLTAPYSLVPVCFSHYTSLVEAERVGTIPTGLGFSGTSSPHPPQFFLGNSRPLSLGHNYCPAQSLWARTKMVSGAGVSAVAPLPSPSCLLLPAGNPDDLQCSQGAGSAVQTQGEEWG